MPTRTRNRTNENRGSTLPANIIAQLGQISDRDLAKLAGVTETTIAKARLESGQPIHRTETERLPANSSMQSALSRWPLRIKGVGLDANILLNCLADAPAGLTVTECRDFTSSHPLGTLIKHKLCHLAQSTPELRYAITPAGNDYLTLLKLHNLTPKRP